MDNKQTTLGIRISEELKQTAINQAQKQGRTLSNYIKYLILKDVNGDK